MSNEGLFKCFVFGYVLSKHYIVVKNTKLV